MVKPSAIRGPFCTTKLRLSSRSSGSAFPLLRVYYKVATFEPELRECVSFTTRVLQSCDFRAGAPGVRFLYYACTTKLRLSSRSSGSAFPLLRVYYKVATSSRSSPSNTHVFPRGTSLLLLGGTVSLLGGTCIDTGASRRRLKLKQSKVLGLGAGRFPVHAAALCER